MHAYLTTDVNGLKVTDYERIFDAERQARFLDFIYLARTILPEHNAYLELFEERVRGRYFYLIDAKKYLDYLHQLISITEKSLVVSSTKKLFSNADDKLAEAVLSFDNNDFTGCFNNLTTACELFLKERFDIPTTITSIGISKVITAIKNEQILSRYLTEVSQKVLIRNKGDHIGFNPSKVDAIEAIKAVENLFSKFKEATISEEVKLRILKQI